MGKIVPVYYAPNIDTGWEQSPGALTDMTQFAPTLRGTYATVGGAAYLAGSITTPPLVAYMFRKVAGTVRLLSFNTTSIDEYDNAGSRTSRGTGFTTGTQWSAAANGDAIVAVNYANASLVSTGASFSALGGGSPKARFICANAGFMMMADYDDGANQYADGVWWSALNNYASWTVSAATQAGNLRLLDTPGPIRAMIPLRDTIVVFKDDSIYIGSYVGPPIFWSWRLVTNRVGCLAQHAVAEYAGVLYFTHTSGIFSFDGATITNIGRPVWQSMLGSIGYAQTYGGFNLPSFKGDIRATQAIVDDVEGSVVFAPLHGATVLTSAVTRSTCYIYNTASQLWGKAELPTTVNGGNQDGGACFVRASMADIQTFLTTKVAARFLYIGTDGSSVTTCNYVGYPLASTTPPSLTTGMIGSRDGSSTVTNVSWRTLAGTSASAMASAIATQYTTEDQNIGSATVNGTINTAMDTADIVTSSKFRQIALTWTSGKQVELKGLGVSIGADKMRR